MKTQTKTSGIVVLLLGALAFIAAAVAQSPGASAIDGDWIVSFTIQGNQTVPGRMTLHTDGRVLTGTVASEHTGPGTLEQGTWTTSQMSATCVFKTHENIAITGEPKDGSLSGSFLTEGMQGTWHAVRAETPNSVDQPH